MNFRVSLYLILFYLACLNSFAQDYKTLTYYRDDSLRLDLDLFLPKTLPKSKIPLFLYVHGGGFSAGNRNAGHPICRYLANHGYAAATISYTLYMKGRDFGCTCSLPEKKKAIQVAVSQLWLATLFFIENQEKFQVDTSKIFIGGGSAGGTTVLHAAFWDHQSMDLYPRKLPSAFRYAGVISGSGALMDSDLVNRKTLLPVMMFHGSCDALVPYYIAAHHYCPEASPGWVILYGSLAIFNRVVSLGGSCCLITFCNGSHTYYNKLFADGQDKILSFIERTIKGEKIQEHEVIQTRDKCNMDSGLRPCR